MTVGIVGLGRGGIRKMRVLLPKAERRIELREQPLVHIPPVGERMAVRHRRAAVRRIFVKVPGRQERKIRLHRIELRRELFVEVDHRVSCRKAQVVAFAP